MPTLEDYLVRAHQQDLLRAAARSDRSHRRAPTRRPRLRAPRKPAAGF
jgi:hypothetical protein